MAYADKAKQAEAAARHYRCNKVLMKARAKAHKAAAIKRNQEYAWDYLLAHPCADCGEPDPIVLTFDHLGNKITDVCTMIRRAVSLQKLQCEIAKCVVRCSNCHTRRTAKQQKWFKLMGVRGVRSSSPAS